MSAPIALLVTALLGAPSAGRVYIDAGHGVGTNSGATAVDCRTEAQINLDIAKSLAARLNGKWRTRLSRKDAAGPTYPRRAQRAARWGADVLLSIHADTRGEAEWWSPQPGLRCPRSKAQPGVAILVSDEARGVLTKRSIALARAVAKRMKAAGFTMYDGFDYGALYDKDEVPGVFLDRRGLFMLRRPKMASVIIETHHAWHPGEAKAWAQTKTRDRFAKAIESALEDVASGS